MKQSGAESDVNRLHQHLGRTPFVKTEFLGRAGTEVNYPPLDKGAAIVDPHDYGAAVFRVRYPHIGRQRQQFVGRRYLARIKGFTVGSHVTATGAQGFIAVPRSDSPLPIGGRLSYGHGIITSTLNRVWRVLHPSLLDGLLGGKTVNGVDIMGERPVKRRHDHVKGILSNAVHQLAGAYRCLGRHFGSLVSCLYRTRGYIVGGGDYRTGRQAETKETGDDL